MAIVTTPLGFKKPDGNELVKGGDNVIADNAQKTEDLIQAAQSGIYAAAASASSALTQAGALTPRVAAVESTTAAQNIRIASVESAAFVGGGLLMEDPTDPGFFLVGA